MSLTSKSPERVVREALAVAVTALPRYPHKFSPKIYTQPQLFACLVLKTFFHTDYRGITQLLTDLPELVRTLGLKTVPDFTTLQKAACRLLYLLRVHRPPHGDHPQGFRLLFSAAPSSAIRPTRARAEWIRRHAVPMDAINMEGWLCPALFKYFTDPPTKLYAWAEPL